MNSKKKERCLCKSLLKNNQSSNKIKISPNLHKREEFLFSNKTNKEILLSLIKSSQVNLLMEIKEKTTNSPKEKAVILKSFLKELKNNLSYILIEKSLYKKYLENNIDNFKSILQKKIEKLNNNKNSKDINNNNHKKEEYIETEIKEKNYEGNELSKLQLQNFKIENEIEKTNF